MKASELKVGERYALGGDRKNEFGQDEVEVVALGVDGTVARRTYSDRGAAARRELEEKVGGRIYKVADVKGGVLVRYCRLGAGAVVTAAQLRSTWDDHIEVIERKRAAAAAAAQNAVANEERVDSLRDRVAALVPVRPFDITAARERGYVTMSADTLEALVAELEAARGATEVAA